MAQYYRLLGSCRRPGHPKDSQFLPAPRDDQHVIVCFRNQVITINGVYLKRNITKNIISRPSNQMYCVPVLAHDRGRLTENEIASQLLFLLSDAPCLPMKPTPIGVLTAEPRSVWAKDRQQLLMFDKNAHNIELIETALCLVCLDESLPISFNANRFSGANVAGHEANGRDETNMAHQMIHGGGSECNTGNRWFDKTMQVGINRTHFHISLKSHIYNSHFR